jgi:hypothetical protein
MSAELGTTLDAALAQLDRAATQASVHEDPLELPFRAGRPIRAKTYGKKREQRQNSRHFGP